MGEARAAYEEALDLDGDHADAHFNLVLLYEELRRLQEALRHLQDYRRLIGR